MKSKNYLLSVVLFFMCYCSMFAQVPVPFTQRIPGGTKIQGDIVFVGNNITNTAPANNPSAANTPYNGTANNNGLNFEYIDIDGDPTTFSSSSADLNINGSCKKIVYAGLYWTATYPFARSGPNGDGTSSNYNGSPRSNTWNQVKFKVPGGAYVSLSADTAADLAGQEDDIIFDGYNAANPNQSFYGAPYVCYKNVTGLLQALANANGTYTIADQRAATGIRPDGISSGWSIVVIYQDPNLPSKYISMFDGYANIDAGVNSQVDFNINGFLTVPAPQPVRARIGVSTLEGDYNITGDNFRIKANSLALFNTITNTLNPNNNFFNGSITNNNVSILNRAPNSTNTLGFDLDIVQVNNPINTVIPNGETGATLRATTNGDSYGVYLTTFDVEIIEPKIVLTKVVQDATGTNIGNGNVNLCQDLNYVIGYQNIGNDDATNFTIKDILPINITFNPATDLVLPPGVTYTYNAGTRTLIFTIPNNQVNIGDPRQEIRIKVKVVCTCIDLDDACSNVIKNQAFASYGGNINNTFVLTDDPSLSTFSACNLSAPSSTNFLVGLDDCDFTRDVVLCGTTVVLTAANGYQSYEWHGPAPSNAIIGTTQSITVSALGTYTVYDNINTSPCKSIVETINVIDFLGAVALTNPVIPYADQVVICPNDNKPLPLIFLCGAGDSQLIQTSISGASSIVWQQLNTGSCAAVVNPNCANTNPACTWTNVGAGPNFTVTTAGQYKVIVNFANGCFREFYFNAFQNLLAPTYTSTDVICTTQGSITVNNVPAGYEYSISSNPGVWQASNVFSPLPAGVYTISIRQIGVVAGCVFTLPNIPIRAHNFTVSTILTQPICTGDKGTINIAANDVNPQYTYSIYQEPGHTLVNTVGPINASNYIFLNLNPGNYSYQVTTQDGCNGTGLFTITTPPLLTVTAAITKPLSCTDGEITVYPVGGTPPYNYIVTGAVTVTQSSPVISAPVAGTYNIQIVDFNNCSANTSITVVATLAPAFNVTHTDIKCSNAGNTGSISINVTNPNGNALMYSIDNGGTFSNSSVFTNLAPGTYNVVVQYSIGSSVCTTTPQAVTITITTPITGIATLTTPYTCTSNGVITVSGVSGGTAPYTYSIGGAYQAGNTFPIVGPGTYIVTIKDANGCTFATAPIVVAPLNPPTDLSFSATALTCPTNTSTVTITATGGDPVLNYQIVLPAASATPYQASNVFNNLAPNTYTFQVKDGKNCTYQESFTINPLPAVTVTGTLVNNVKCFGSSTGSVSFTVSGSTGFTYTINAGASTPGTSPVVLTNLPAGPYTIVVTNTATNCTATATVTVNGPAAALAAPVTTTPITCITSGGQATVNAAGGWGGYTYVMVPMPGGVTQSGNVFSNIPVGTYTITTTDSGGCAVTANFTLTAPVAPTATISPLSDFCYDGNSATIIINAAGGVPPYKYKVNAGGYQLSNTFGPLVPGSYTFTVMDSFGCTVTLPVQTIMPRLTLNTVLTKPLDCTASPSAVITGTIGAGTGYAPYTYQVSVNAGSFLPAGGIAVVGSTFTYTAVTSGSYQFMVTDAHGCTATSGVIAIAPLVAVAATHVKTDNKCFGDASGTVTITPSGGVAPYQVQFGALPFSSTLTYTNLAAGTYNYVVRDSRSCTFNGSVTITQPTQITYNTVVNPITCNPAGGPYLLGSICVNGLTGGTAPYTYTLIDNIGGGAPIIHSEPAGANYCFPNVDFGDYNVIVTDANGCTIVKSNLIMSNPPSDLTFVIAGSVPSCAAGATVTVTLVGAIGAGPFEFAIMNSPTFPFVNPVSNFVPASNPPFTHVFNGLTPGAIFTIVVRDITTGCYYFEQMQAPTATNSTMNVTSLIPNNVTCRGAANGSVTFSLSGIDPTTTSIAYSIHYASNNLPVPGASNSGTLTPPFPVLPLSATIGGSLPPGTYNIQLTEIGPGAVSGCGITSVPFTITESAVALTLTATTTNDNCNVNAGQIAPVASGGTAPYLYQYGPTGFVPGPWVGPVVNPYQGESGNYDVVVRDANGCIVRIPVTIGLDPTPVIAATVANACAAQGAFAINVTLPTAGVAPYTFSFDNGAYQAQTPPFSYSALSSGAHTVQVKDVNGCGNLVNVNILAPLVVSATFTTMPTCLNNDGTITAVASGGSGNYTYTLFSSAMALIAGPQASAVFPNQPAGSYIIRVTDTTTGCSADNPFNIPLPTPVTYTTATTAVSCNGASDGTITINLSAGNNNPAYTYQILVPPVGPQASNIFTGLPAGTYSVQVNSGSGCSVVTNNVVVGSPAVVVATTTATPFTCAANNSVNTSTVTVTGAGGTVPYSYSIDGVNYFPSGTFTVSTAGNITGYVKDAHGCIDTDIFVLAPLPALVSATVNQTTAITCNNPELVTITVVGGSGNFTYQALPSGAPNVTQVGVTNQFNISAPGTYFFQVNDVTTGCYIATLGYTVAPYNTINVVATATKPVTCFGGNDGAATINVSGYSGAYSFNVLDNTNTSIQAGVGNTAINPLTINALPAGNYTVQVTETASPFCVKVSNIFTIASPSAALTLNAVETANVTCSNDKGVITATATGGWGTYTYSIAPVAGVQTGNVFSNLPAGNYTITVTDLLTCSATSNVILVLPAPINSVIAASALSVNCFGDETASISISYPTGGQGSNYSYVLTTNSPASASGPIAIPLGGVVISGLGADTYTITITDGYGCQYGPISLTIGEPTLLSASLVVATTQTCLNNTTLTLTGSGGTQPYTYSTNAAGPYVPFVPAASTSTTITVPVGTYSYYIKDANGCISNVSNGITIVPLTPLAFTTLTSTNILCGGSNSGTITAAAIGGLSNYVYTLLDGAGNPVAPAPTQLTPGNFSNLAPGTYQVLVTSVDCTFTSPNITITAPPTLVINAVASAAKCKGDNSGTITLTVTGGTGTIQYAISPNLSQFITIPNPAGGYVITGLTAGTYTVIVQDQNGCTPMPPLSIVVGEPALALSGAITAFTDETCAEFNDGTLTIANIAGGTAPYTVSYSVIYPDNTVVAGPVIALPLGTTTYTFANLNGGIYTALITDANGCKFDQEQVVGSGVLYDPYAQVTFPCDNNSPGVRVEVVNLSNPPSLAFVPAADFLFALDVPGNTQLSNIFTSATNPSLLVPGNHIIYVTNVNSCDKQTQQFTINAADVDPLTLVLSQGGLNTILATATGGSGGYTYTFNGYNNGSNNTYVYQQSGLYTVVVTDSSGCTATASKYFEFIPIFIPNVFTPNGDGHNPMWGPTNTGNYKDLVTKVYDRYGRVVAELAEGQFWDGKYNNQELPSGDYWYVIKVDGNNDSEYVGHFTLYR